MDHGQTGSLENQKTVDRGKLQRKDREALKQGSKFPMPCRFFFPEAESFAGQALAGASIR